MIEPTSGMIKASAKKKLKSHVFLGLSLAGGKNDKTCMAVLEYFPEHGKVFLSRLYEKISNSKYVSPDHSLFELIRSLPRKPDAIAFDVPLSLPKCISCKLSCPGVARCKVTEVSWMKQQFEKRFHKKKRPNKLFTPYTQRAIEMYLEDELEEKFFPSHALGANAAPLVARAQFLQRRLKSEKLIEVFPALSTWRIGAALRVSKSHLRNYKKSVDGNISREVFLKALVEKNVAFVYQQDIKAMTNKPAPFEAFIAGLTAYFNHIGETEKKPKGFPRTASWIEFPIEGISW